MEEPFNSHELPSLRGAACFKEAINAINALNTLGIRTERVDENNGIIEAKKKDRWFGDQDVQISIAPHEEGCSFYVEARRRLKGASGTCGITGTSIMQVMTERLTSLGYDKMVELAPMAFDKPSRLPAAQTAYAPPPQAQPPPSPPSSSGCSNLFNMVVDINLRTAI